METNKPKSKKSLVPVVLLLVLMVVGLFLGPIGVSYLPFSLPESFKVPKPEVKLPAEEISHVGNFSITNTLIAISGPDGSAVIRKTLVGGTMAVAILPEPGVLGLVALAGLAAARRRRA